MKSMKTNTYVTKDQLVTDYVTKADFTEFREEMRDSKQDLDTRFDAIDARLVAHDKRFDAIDARLSAHDKRFDAIETRLSNHDKRFDKLDRRMDSIEDNVRRMIGAAVDQLTYNLKIGMEHMMYVQEGKKDRSRPFPF